MKDNFGTISKSEALPHNLDAEVGLLGSIFAEAENDDRTEFIEEAISVGVIAEWFFEPKHQLIWESIRNVFKSDFAPAHLIVCEHLGPANK